MEQFSVYKCIVSRFKVMCFLLVLNGLWQRTDCDDTQDFQKNSKFYFNCSIYINSIWVTGLERFGLTEHKSLKRLLYQEISESSS